MKKILLSLVICLGLVSFASLTFAQSTAVEPYDGATHTYTFAGVEANASYEFYVTATNDHTAASIPGFGLFVDGAGDPIAGTGIIGAANGPASIKINWSATASADYPTGVYLFLRVTAQGSSCGFGNYKGVHIVPVLNDFNVTVADLGALANPSCADISALQPVINNNPLDLADETHYDPGTTTMSFEIERKTGTNPWSGEYTVSCSEGTVPFKINTGAVATGDKTDIIDGEVGNTVTVTVVMTNTPGKNPVFTLTMTSASDDTTGLEDLTLGSDSHTINLMPNIGGFIGS